MDGNLQAAEQIEQHSSVTSPSWGQVLHAACGYSRALYAGLPMQLQPSGRQEHDGRHNH